MADTTPLGSRSANALTKRQEYEMIRSELWNERSTFDAQWKELGEYILPRRPRFLVTDRNKGDRRNQKAIDSTATFAAGTLRSGMHAGITSPARPWVRLSTPDPDLAEFGPVKEWLHIVTRRMLTVMHGTNLYNALPILYGDEGVFATGAMGVLDDTEDLFRCYPYPIGSYAIGTNYRGLVDTFVREYQLTVRQLVYEFGLDRRTNMIDWTNLSRTVRNLWDRAQYHQAVDVCWIVCPNAGYDNRRIGAKYLPFHSVHIEKGQDQDQKFLRESGFNEFPVLVGRWERTAEDAYGTSCPGMSAIGDIKQLQFGEKKGGQALSKMVDPPLQAPTHVRNQKASLLPGDITYTDVREGQKGITPIHEVNFAIEKLEAKQEAIRRRIQRAFYEDLFLMLATSDRREITAREIDERHEEKLLALGPVVEGTKDDILDKLVDRVYAMMDRNRLIPPPPEELVNVKLKIEYISLMAQAQKLVGVVGQDRFMQSVVGIMDAFPEVRHKVNAMQAVDDWGDMLGVNPKLIVPDDDAQASLDAERQAQAQQMQSAAMAEEAKAAKTLSETNIEEDSALTAMANIMGAAA